MGEPRNRITQLTRKEKMCENEHCKCENCTCDPCECTPDNLCGCDEDQVAAI